MTRSAVWAVCVLAAAGIARGEPRHAVVETKQPLTPGLAANGILEVSGGRLVACFYQARQPAGGTQPYTVVIDAATLKTVACYPDCDPAYTWTFERTAVLSDSTADLFRIVDLAQEQEVKRLKLPGACSPDGLYVLAGKGVQRLDPATGEPRWTTMIPALNQFCVGRRSVWIRTFRTAVQLSATDGKELSRYELPAAELAASGSESPTLELLPVGDKDLPVMCVGGVPAGKGAKGALYRLLEGGRPKDLVVPGGRPWFAKGGRGSGTRALSFERKGKPLVVVYGTQDGEGPIDSQWSIDVRKWKLTGARSPVLPEAPDGWGCEAGWATTGNELWDLGEGKKAHAIEGRWLDVADRCALAWDPAAKVLTRVPLPTGAAVTASLPDATEVTAQATTAGDEVVVLVGREAGTTVARLDAAGALETVGELEGAGTILAMARRVVAGVTWVLVGETKGSSVTLHLYGLEARPAR